MYAYALIDRSLKNKTAAFYETVALYPMRAQAQGALEEILKGEPASERELGLVEFDLSVLVPLGLPANRVRE
jgi:hypothetical protein